MKHDIHSKLLAFLQRLKEAKIAYQLAHHRDEAIMVLISVPGERWEVEFLDDGAVDIEIFKSDGKMLKESALNDLFTRFSD